MRVAAPLLQRDSGHFQEGGCGVKSPDFGLRNPRRGFTLMEIMIVVAIMAIVMATGLPLVVKARKREPLNQAVRDIVEVCSNARAQAILHGKMTELVISPRDRRFQISGAVSAAPKTEETEDIGFKDPGAPPPPASGLSAVLSDHIAIEMLDVNLLEYKDQETARVRFHPNGTCDEFTVVLHSDRGEWMKIWLEITTGLANVGPLDAR